MTILATVPIFTLVESIHTASGMLRSWQLLPLQKVPLFCDDQHCAELIAMNLVEPDPDAQLERAHQVESAPDEQSLLRALGSV
jgi:hypothetical protein